MAERSPVVNLIECHRIQGLTVNEHPTLNVPSGVKELRCRLIEEEAEELRAAIAADDIIAVADAIGDLLYVVYGAAVTFGIPVDDVFAEIHRSNLTKLDADGHPVYRSDGKVMKGPGYSPPDLLPILAKVAKSDAEVARWRDIHTAGKASAADQHP